MQILIVQYSDIVRRWQIELLQRLEAAGHAVAISHAGPAPRDRSLAAVLAVESRRACSLLSPRPAPAERPGTPELVIDLTGAAGQGDVPTLALSFSGQMNLAAGLSQMMARQELPEIIAWLDGVAVARARPMVGDRVWLTSGASDLLAGAVGLIEQCVGRFGAGLLTPLAEPVRLPRQRSGSDLLLRYVPNLVGGLIRRRIRKLHRRSFYWQTAYRRLDGQGVAEDGALSGAPFALLPDDGKRFFADPFVIEREGRTFLFVEEFPYALARGVVSVAELGDDGRFGMPRQVLVEPHHLSYPQVFELGGEVWMIPETSAEREVVLYRAEQFPDRWVRHATLIADREISDATLLERDGRFWMFGTERQSQGNHSDTMVVYSADKLDGPWLPHPMNPVLIDRSAARPGGAFVTQGERLFLPVQDGTRAYGGGLGLAELVELNPHAVRFAAPRPVLPGKAWDRAGIHTLNRAGGIEVIDSAG
jgi:hypothetical protein